MDAATSQKLKDIAQWVSPGLIVDAGIGTGAILKALSKKFPSSQMIGIDASRHFAALAKKKFRNNPKIEIIHADLRDPVVPADSASTMIFSAVLHELYSYNGYSMKAVVRALKNARRALVPGGRLIIRDGVRPIPKEVFLWLKNDTELHNTFRKFSREFKYGSGAKYEKYGDGEKTMYRLDLATAYEFLSKKDYKENWGLEINEEFGYLTLPGYKKLLEGLGFRIISARSYRNPWIIKNRWQGQAKIFERKSGRLREISFPDTNLVIVTAKRSA